jgi:hypothetical protein
MLKGCAIALLISQVVAAAPPQQTLKSGALAKQLAAALQERGLDAVATRDPNESDRFVAALFYPNAQLLVISARYASPPLLNARLSQRQYRDVYLDLGSAPIPNTSMLVQDMSADGLCDSRDKTADILYEGNVTSMFDADWKSHNRSELEYMKRLGEADERYSRMLELLLAEVKRA